MISFPRVVTRLLQNSWMQMTALNRLRALATAYQMVDLYDHRL
jgi:hypothetical protein